MKEKPEQDEDLFRRSLGGVTPLKPSNRIAPAPSQRPAIVRDQSSVPGITDTLSDHGADAAPLSEFRRDGVSPMTLRKLRRGQFPVQDSLDLHGLTSDEARKLLLEFLYQASQHGLRCVHIIHGKGWHTKGGEGILKNRARHWLIQCPDVLAFCEAPPQEGGSGAVRVLLRLAA